MKRNQAKRAYLRPESHPSEVSFERSLLVATARLLLEVDELENVNAETTGADEAGGEMYFEF